MCVNRENRGRVEVRVKTHHPLPGVDVLIYTTQTSSSAVLVKILKSVLGLCQLSSAASSFTSRFLVSSSMSTFGRVARTHKTRSGEEKKMIVDFYAFFCCAYLYAHVSRIEIILIFMYDVVRSWPGEHIISSFLGSSPPLLLQSTMVKKWNCDPLWPTWNSGACMTKLKQRRKKELRILTGLKNKLDNDSKEQRN